MSLSVERVGGEFLVNPQFANSQIAPTVTALPGGGFVMSWQDESGTLGDGDRSIKAQLFDATGAKLGEEFLVNTETANWQTAPTITALAGGGFVIGWADTSGTQGDWDGSIKAQIFDAVGARIGGEFRVNTQTLNWQTVPSITALSGGGFVVTWQDQSRTLGDDSGTSIKAQIFDATGMRVGDEFLVNTQTGNSQMDPVVTGLADGGFVVSWADLSFTLGDASGFSVKAQVFDATGARVGGEFLVNDQVSSDQRDPALAGLADGGFVVTWVDFQPTPEDASGYNIKARRFDADGTPLDAEFLVNQDVQLYQSLPTVTGLDDGGFVISWTSAGSSYYGASVGSSSYGLDDDHSIRAQVFDASGARIGNEFVVTSSDLLAQRQPTIASLADQGFVIGWVDFGGTLGDASGASIKAQIFQLEPEPPANAGPDLLTASGPVGAGVVLDGGLGEDTLRADAAVFDPAATIRDIEVLEVVGQYGGLQISAEQLAGFTTLRSATPGQFFGITATTPGLHDLTRFTLQGLASFEGSPGDDTIQGAPGDLAPGQILNLRGGGGNDLILGTARADNLFDDAGQNTLKGGEGNDVLAMFGTATGVMEGEGGNDTLLAGSSGGPLSLIARGGAGDDNFSILGPGGSVTLEAGEGQDFILVSAFGGTTITLALDAGAGDDQIVVSLLAAGSVLDGGAGEDSLTLVGPLDPGVALRNIETLLANGSVNLSAAQLATLSRIETPEGSTASIVATTAGLYDFTGIVAPRLYMVDGSAGDDTIRGLATGNFFRGGAGNDRLESSGLSFVWLQGDEGNDTILGGAGVDNAQGGAGADVLEGDAGNDMLNGGADDDWLDGGEGDDFLFDIDGGNDTLLGGEGKDYLEGGEGSNRLEGGAGDDTLRAMGLAGQDNVMDGGAGADNISAGAGNDTIEGGEGDDTVFAGEGDNLISGGEGNDNLAGSAGNDTLLGGAGNDFLSSIFGTNLVEGGEGNDTIFGGGLQDTLLGGAGDDSILGPGIGTLADGGEGNDTILAQGGRAVGGEGNDSLSGVDAELDGGEGDDILLGSNVRMEGGAGNDSFHVGVSGPDGVSVAQGGAGDDLFRLGTHGPGATLEGGEGQDTLELRAIWEGSAWNEGRFTFTLDPGIVLTGIETLRLAVSEITLAAPGFTLEEWIALEDRPTVSVSAAGTALGLSAAQLAGFTTLIGAEGEGVRLQATTAGHYDLSGKTLEGALVLTGSAGDDTLTGTAADDTLAGGAGDDVLEGGEGFDTAVFAGRRADYTINFAPDGTLSLAETDTLRGIERLLFVDMSVQQGAAGGQIVAARGDTPAALVGADTNDTLNGGAGADTLTGGAGQDQFAGTVAELDGDRIADYEAEEVILVQDAHFTAGDVTLTQGSTIISVDTDDDGTPDLTITLDLDLPDLLAMGLILKVTDTPEGTEISFVPAPSLAITADAPSQAESVASYSFTVTRTGESFAASSANWTVTGADAEDFAGGVLPGGTVSFAPGEMSQTITLAIADDAVIEPDEGFTITLSDAVGATLAVATAEGVILNDDASFLSIAAEAPGVAEGDFGLTEYRFTVTRTGDASGAAQAFYATTGGLAASGSDFIPASGVVGFAPGETTQTITILGVGDSVVEADESFTVALIFPDGAVIGTGTADIAILNDDIATYDIAADAPALAEGDAGLTPYTFTVSRDNVADQDVLLDWFFTSMTASSADVQVPGGQLIFGAYQTTATITVNIIGDAQLEGDESFAITLLDPNLPGAALGTATATGVILDDDDTSTFTITAAAPGVAEGDVDLTVYNFVVTRSGDTSGTAQVFYETGSGTAINGVDFFTDLGVVDFAPGEVSHFITIFGVGDTVVEADESFTVTLFGATGGTIGTATAEGVFLNDDIAIYDIAADAPALPEGDAGLTPYVFTVTRSHVADQDVVLDWLFTSITAGPADVQVPGGQLVFGAYQTSATITVNIIGDTLMEGDESFTITLLDPNQPTVILGTATATGVITDDDLTLPPPSTPDLAAASDLGLSDSDDLTADRTPTLTGTAPIGSTVTLFEGGEVIGSGVALDGTWSITTTPLAGGPRSITATATLDGVTSEASAPLLLTLDATAPTLALTVDDVLLNGSETGLVTFTASEAITGLTLADLQVSGGTLGPLATSDNITFTAAFTPEPGFVGEARVAVTAGGFTDLAGNAGSAATIGFDGAPLPDRSGTPFGPLEQSFTLVNAYVVDGDTDYPGTGYDAAQQGDRVGFNGFQGPMEILRGSDFDFLGGSFAAGFGPVTLTISAYDDGALRGAQSISLTTGIASAFVADADIFTSVDRLLFTVTGDAPGYWVSAPMDDLRFLVEPELVFDVDAEAPEAPVIGAIDTDTGTPGDFITTDRNLTFSGTAEAGSSVLLTLGGATLGTVLAADGSWSFDHTATTLALGEHVLTAQAVDAAGNLSGIDTQLIRVIVQGVTIPCLTSWGQHYEGTPGDDSFCIQGSGNSVTSGDGDDLIRMQGWNNVIAAGAGNDTIEAGQGQARVDAGSGDNIIRLEGWNNQVVAADGDNVVERPAGNSSVRLGDGVAAVTMDGWSNEVVIGDTPDGGRSVIQAGQGNSVVTAGDGALEVALGGWGNRIEAGEGPLAVTGPQGHSTVTASGGPTVITMGGWGNQIILGAGGPHVIDAGMGNARVEVAGGDATIVARGWNNEIRTGDGDDVISGMEGSSFVWAGDGDNRVTATGWWNRIETGAGADEITAGDGGAEVRAGAGNDVVRLAGWHNRVEAGAGDDTIHAGEGGGVFALNAPGDGVDRIFDFGAAMGDRLELRGVAQAQFQVAAVGADLSVRVGGTEVALLMGQSGLTLEELLAQGSLVFL